MIGSEVVVPFAAPRRVGRYELFAELASGGMGTVYLGRLVGPRGFDKWVAVKCIHPHLAREPEFVNMFLDEARISSRIVHPNVCGVFDAGEDSGTYFIAMEFLFGESIARVAHRAHAHEPSRNSPWVVAYAARVAADACEGLHAAHELRDDRQQYLHVVHRDVSPQNLFITYDGCTHVMDFGVARAAGRLHQTTTRSLKGKAAYMSPEQVLRRDIDRRSDVWALGVVLWEFMTGTRLFKASDEIATLQAVVEKPIPPPSHIRSGVPSEIDEIVMRALAREPDERFATAREFGQALSDCLVRMGRNVGMPEIGAWLEELFEHERKDKTALLERIKHMNADAEMAVVRSNGAREITTRVLRIGSKTKTWWFGLVPLSLAVLAVLAVATLDHSAWKAAANRPSKPAASSRLRPVNGQAVSMQGVGPPRAEDEQSIKTTTRESDNFERPRNPTHARHIRAAASEAHMKASPSSTVMLDVATPGGWADLSVDARPRGRTPARLRLASGRHVLVLKPFGRGPSKRKVITLVEGRPGKWILPLQ